MGDDSADLDFYTFFCFCIDDSDARVRERAIVGLWECEDRALIPVLIKRLAHDSDEAVRATAAMVLGRFAVLAQQGKLLAKDSERVYRALLEATRRTDEGLEVRRRALESIGAFQSQEVKELLVWGYNSPEAALRQSALCAMGRNCDSTWLPIIVGEMESTNPAIRYEAANACREMGEEAAVPHLAVLVEDEDLEVQLSAIQALGAIGGAKAKRLLRHYGRTAHDETVREAIDLALAVVSEEDQPLRFKQAL
jgi:HEAT repeat protein